MSPGLLPSLRVRPGELPGRVLFPGDPGRAAAIADRLEGGECLAQNREFHVYRGRLGTVPIGVVSTGVGAPGAALAVEEAIRAGARVLIRVGTAGSLQDHIQDGHLVVAWGAARCEGTTPRLLPIEWPALSDPEVAESLWKEAEAQGTAHRGVVVTLDVFYRGLLDLGLEQLSACGALAVEMECASLFCVASLRRVAAGAVLAIDGDARAAAAGRYDPHRNIVQGGIDRAIAAALEAATRLKLPEHHSQTERGT